MSLAYNWNNRVRFECPCEYSCGALRRLDQSERVHLHWETLSCFSKFHEDFDYTEIDCMVRIEICLSNDSKSVVCF